jgi:hypothetical protein
MGSDTPNEPRLNVNGTQLLGLNIVPLSSTFPFETRGDWNQSSGTLKLVVIGNALEIDDLSFSFLLRNPAKSQAPPSNQVTVEVQQGIKFEADTFILPIGKNMSEYPITVDAANFTVKLISQSSSWPCAQNTIDVFLRSNVRLLKACSPTATIIGLTDMLTNSTDHLTIIKRGASNAPAINGTWNQIAGTLKIEFAKFEDSAQEFNLSFVLRNPSRSRNALAIFLEGVISSANSSTIRQSTTGSSPGARTLIQNLDASDTEILEYQRLLRLHNQNRCPDKCTVNCTGNLNCTRCPENCTEIRCPENCTGCPSVCPKFPTVNQAEALPARRLFADDNVGFVRNIFFLVKTIVQSGAENSNLPTDPWCPPPSLPASSPT